MKDLDESFQNMYYTIYRIQSYPRQLADSKTGQKLRLLAIFGLFLTFFHKNKLKMGIFWTQQLTWKTLNTIYGVVHILKALIEIFHFNGLS